MSIIYYHHIHPTKDFSDFVTVNSNTPIQRDLDGSGYYSDRIYHARNSNARFYVVTFGYEKSWGYDFWPRKLNRYTLHFIFSGKGTYNGMQLSAGDIFVVPTNTTYQINRDKKSPLTFGWIALSGLELELMINILHLPCEPTTKFNFDQIHQVEQLFINTIYASHPDKDIPFFLFSRLFHILSMSNISYVPLLGSNNVYVDHAMQYININYASDIKVTEIAKEVNISTAHLRDVFLKELGHSPQRAIINKRIAVAKSLLLSDSPPSIETIAQLCGYSNASAFVKKFKNEVGISPGKYQKENTKQSKNRSWDS